jgi:hypothetical protein
LQIGAEAIDVVMLVMNDNGMERMLSSKFKSALTLRRRQGRWDGMWKAKPIGRCAPKSLRTLVLAGVTVNGASITQDKDGTRIFYGRMIPSAQILKGQVKAPEGSHKFLAAVRKYGTEANVAETSARRTEGGKTGAQNEALSPREAKGAIEEKLKSEPGLESRDIQVTLTADAVKLSGSVVSADDRDKAVRIARSYAGAREVQDRLTFQTP